MAWKPATAEYSHVQCLVKRSKKVVAIRGLNKNHNHDLKISSRVRPFGPPLSPDLFQEFYAALVAQRDETSDGASDLARKSAAITLIVWKKECISTPHT